MSGCLTELRAIRPVPGDDGIEAIEQTTWRFESRDAHRIESSTADCADAVGEQHQWRDRAGNPDFQIVAALTQTLERGKTEDAVADAARTDSKKSIQR